MPSHLIYKIMPEDNWDTATRSGIFTGAGIDITDGFIHFSTASQLAETLALHFKGAAGLILAEIDASGLDILYEPARNGQLFPHLYDQLDMIFVTRHWFLNLDAHDRHILPEDLSLAE